MPRDAGRRRIYRSRAVRRRRSLLVVLMAVAFAAIAVATVRGGGLERFEVAYDRRAAVAYADSWALRANPEYWSSPDNDCANFVSQCLTAGGLRPLYDSGREWHANGTEFPTVAWVNCGAQKRTLSARTATHSRYIARTTRTLPDVWAAGDIVYLGNLVEGAVEWQHVIICAGKEDDSWVYDSHTTAYRRRPLEVWYPAHFSRIRFCHIGAAVTYADGE
jgi:hypothetical protein